jgi:NAD(P)-dependent dehydrogenase (short-subunit alcohol dehydrogenase family)
VLVTGAAGGIGRASVERFFAAEADVFAADINPAALSQTIEAMAGGAGSVRPVEVDVTNVEDCGRMVASVIEAAGRLDVLVNCAGLWVEGPTETMTEADWDRVVNVNLKGTFFTCRYAIPELKKTNGCIVNLSSDAGVVGTPETAIYTASKGGVSLLTKSLALELAPDLVRVNAVCPADVMTPMLEFQAREYGGGDEQGYYDRLLANYPQGKQARFIQPQEIAELVYYLASPRAAAVTGSLFSIDFGTAAGYS